MSLAKCILSQNVRRVRVCVRLSLPARNHKAPSAVRVFLLGRADGVNGRHVGGWLIGGDGGHLAGALWIL
jgi:hypothetical protein